VQRFRLVAFAWCMYAIIPLGICIHRSVVLRFVRGTLRKSGDKQDQGYFDRPRRVVEGISPNTARYTTEKRPSSEKPYRLAISPTLKGSARCSALRTRFNGVAFDSLGDSVAGIVHSTLATSVPIPQPPRKSREWTGVGGDLPPGHSQTGGRRSTCRNAGASRQLTKA